MFTNVERHKVWHVKCDIKTMSIFFIYCLVLIQVDNTNGWEPVCVSGVSKYASSQGLGFYYECQPGNDSPVLRECPGGAAWNRKTMECGEIKGLSINRKSEDENQDIDNDESEIFFQPTLGRNVRLGDLYDARRDLPLNGFSLWNEDIIENNKLVQSKLYSNTKFFFEKTQDDRLSKLSVNAELKLSFLYGLIEVTGSAHYLRDHKETLNHIRFNMMYEATTRTETLPMSLRRKLSYNDICLDTDSKSGPTHVISSVEYGMKAIFIFEKFVKREESQEKIGGRLAVKVKKIPSFKLEVDAKINVSGTVNKSLDYMDVRMYGDFIVDNSPTTFEDAIAVYSNISKYLGDKAANYSQSSPLRIMLTPMKSFCGKHEIILAGISAQIMTKATEIMVDLQNLMLRVRTLESTYLANKFLDISALLKLFRIKLDVYTIELKSNLSVIIPEIRAGEGEASLAALLVNYTDSAFQYDYGVRFLQEREREINTINSLFNDDYIRIGYIKIGDFTSANIAEAILHKTHVFIYKFNVFSNINVTEDYLNNNRNINEDTWYNNYMLIGLAGYNWREFKSFVKLNKDSSQNQEFFIHGSPLGHKLTQIFVYENGVELTSDFKVPMSPPKPKVLKKTFNSVTLLLGNAENIIENEFVTELFVRYWTDMEETNYRHVNIKINSNQVWTLIENTDCWNSCGGKGGLCDYCGVGGYCCRKGFDDCPRMAQQISYDFYSCVINSVGETGEIRATIEIPFEGEVKIGNKSEVIPITHTFITAYQTSFGRGRNSEPLTGVRPLACSPPKLYPVRRIDSTTVKLKWQKPDVISEFLIISGYKLDITNLKKIENISDLEITITDLEPATKYTVSLEVWLSDWMIVGENAIIDFYTLPSQPEKLSAIKIDKHDVTLQVDSEELVIAEGAIFKRYEVIFYKVDEDMNEIPGTKEDRKFQDSLLKISSLTQGTKYNFQYRVTTSKGSSLFSPPLLITTHYSQSDMDKINVEIDKRMEHINTEITKLSVQVSHLHLAPLGTIIAWVRNPMRQWGTVVDLPDGWQRCDGSIILEPSIWAGLNTPNLNGEKRFLRGGNDEDMLNMEEDTTKIPDHTHIDMGHVHNISLANFKDSEGESKCITGVELRHKCYIRQDPKFSFQNMKAITSKSNIKGVDNLQSYAKETKPKNMNVIYIIKVLDPDASGSFTNSQGIESSYF